MRGRVLVVDDEDVVRHSCVRVLEDEGYAVVAVDRGEKAYPILEEGGIRAVLLDLKMPGVSGTDVLAWIRERWPALPVVIMTGYATRETRREVEGLGATVWVPKPFGPPELLEALDRALAGS